MRRRIIIGILLILLIALYLSSRLYRINDTFTFSFDQYRDAWEVKKIIIDYKLTLLGPQSSFYGIFYGPIFYYSLVPFYWLTSLTPIGGAYWAIAVGLVTLLLLYFTSAYIFSYKTALFSTLIYIFSSKINLLLNRDCRNDPPLFAISIAVIWVLVFLSRNKNKDNYLLILLLGILSGLGLHFHFAAIMFLPLVIISFAFLKINKIFIKSLIVLIAEILMLLPLLVFDFIHNHLIFRSIDNLSKQVGSSGGMGYPQKLFTNILLVISNFRTIIIPQNSDLFIWLTSIVFVLFFLYVYLRNSKKFKETKTINGIFLLWVLAPVLIFSLYPTENYYYFYILNFPVFIYVLSRGCELALKQKYWRYLTPVFLIMMFIFNFKAILTTESSRSLKLTDEAMQYIKEDSGGKPILMDYFSKDSFKVGFDYLVYNYKLNIAGTDNSQQLDKYIIYVPINKIQKNYKKTFGDIGIVYQPAK